MKNFAVTLIVLAAIFTVIQSTSWKDVSAFRSRSPGRCNNTASIVYFDCGNSTADPKCIPLSQVHNGNADCPDGSDEYCFAGYVNCGPYCVLPSDVTISCSNDTTQRLCPVTNSVPCKGYGECILTVWFLDGKSDCLDGSDEDPIYAALFLGSPTSTPSTDGGVTWTTYVSHWGNDTNINNSSLNEEINDVLRCTIECGQYWWEKLKQFFSGGGDDVLMKKCNCDRFPFRSLSLTN